MGFSGGLWVAQLSKGLAHGLNTERYGLFTEVIDFSRTGIRPTSHVMLADCLVFLKQKRDQKIQSMAVEFSRRGRQSR